MKGTDRKKELQRSYKERTIIGGVYKVTNTENGRYLLSYAATLEGAKSRFVFSQEMNSCVHPKLQADWKEFGKDAFVFEILEELKKTDVQSDKEFKEDLAALTEIWAEKLDPALLY